LLRHTINVRDNEEGGRGRGGRGRRRRTDDITVDERFYSISNR